MVSTFSHGIVDKGIEVRIGDIGTKIVRQEMEEKRSNVKLKNKGKFRLDILYPR